jgi:branched-chain amino acid aminotransferase
MNEYTRQFFSCIGKLKPVAEFEKYFGARVRYIYEVFRVQEGVPLFIGDHLQRLWTTAKLEGVNLPFTRDDILEDIFGVIRSNPSGDGNIKILISLPATGPVSRLVYFNPHQYPTAEQFENGVAVSLFNAERNNPNAKVMDMKLRSATDQAKSEGEFYEVLLVDHDGYITEGSRSNVFFIKNQKLITPPVHKVLEGITRKLIMQLCAENMIPAIERTVHQNDLSGMDAVFITGTSRRVLPVCRIDDLSFEPSHQLTRKLQHMLEEQVKAELAHRRGWQPEV